MALQHAWKETHWIPTSATVEKQNIVKTRYDAFRFVTYSYEWEGVKHQPELKLLAGSTREYRTGEHIAIKVNPNHPDESILVSVYNFDRSLIFLSLAWFTVVILVVGYEYRKTKHAV
jgi:hypothetical protein